MKPSRLDAAAGLILGGILAEVPRIGCDQLDALLARVSLLYRRKVDKDATDEEIEEQGHELVVRMASAASHSTRTRRPPPAPIARGRLGNLHRTKRINGQLVCIICDTPIAYERNGRGGRVPSFCDRHKNPKNRK